MAFFFFWYLFLFFFLFTSAETNDGAKRATWETNLGKQFQEGSGTVQESCFPSPPFRSTISPIFPLLATWNTQTTAAEQGNARWREVGKWTNHRGPTPAEAGPGVKNWRRRTRGRGRTFHRAAEQKGPATKAKLGFLHFPPFLCPASSNRRICPALPLLQSPRGEIRKGWENSDINEENGVTLRGSQREWTFSRLFLTRGQNN